MDINKINPNLILIGVGLGVGVYLISQMKDAAENIADFPGDYAEWVNSGAKENAEKVAEAKLGVIEYGAQYPFSPFWWWDKIQNAYNEVIK